MPSIVRILLALQICLLFVTGCAVDDDDAYDAELTTEASDTEEVAAPDAPAPEGDVAVDGSTSTAEKALCTSFRLNSRATRATCRSHCASRGQTALAFDDTRKICRCCSAGPL
jgi:hypothetical protein